VRSFFPGRSLSWRADIRKRLMAVPARSRWGMWAIPATASQLLEMKR
jgi:hypothetical protein